MSAPTPPKNTWNTHDSFAASDANILANEAIYATGLAQAAYTAATVPFGYCQSELASGTYAGFDTLAKIQAVLQGIENSGAQYVRVAAWWNVIEPTLGGGYTWTGLDQFMSIVGGYGLIPIVCITSPAPTGATVTAYGLLCAAIAARYGSSGTGQLQYYEIWNEENDSVSAGPFNTGNTSFSPATYASLLIVAATAIRAHDSKALIVFGGTASTINYPPTGTQTDYLPSTWLQGVLDNGGGNYFDIFNMHWYAGSVNFTGWLEPSATHPVYIDMQTCHAKLIANGMSTKPFWITEMGLPNLGAGLDNPVQRADWMVEQIQLVRQLGFVNVWFIFNYEDDQGQTAANNYGAINASLVKYQPFWDTIANINAVTPAVPAGSVGVPQLAPGNTTPSSSNFYRGDGTWQTPSGGGGGGLSYETTVGDGSSGPWTITHSLGTRLVTAVIRRTAEPTVAQGGTALTGVAPGQIIDVTSVVTGLNTISVQPDEAWGTNEFFCDIIGVSGGDVTAPVVGTVASSSITMTSVVGTASGFTDGVGIAGYNWMISGGSFGGTPVLQGTTAGTSFTFTSLAPSTTYTLYAQAFDLAGNPSTNATTTALTTTGSTTPTFDATAISAQSGLQTSTLSLSWTHSIGSGTNNCGIVAVVGGNGGSGLFVPTGTPTASIGSTSLTYLGSVLLGNIAQGGFIAVWGVLGVPTGSQTVAISMNDSGQNVVNAYGVSFTYSGITAIGTLQTLFNTNGSAQTPLSVPSAINDFVWGLVANYSTGGYTSPTFTSREYQSVAAPLFNAGDAAGASSVSMGATQSSTFAGAIVGLSLT